MTQPDKTSGQFHSTKGTATEAVGNAIGSNDLSQSGKEEHAQGEAETNAAKFQNFVSGVSDQITGYAKSVGGALGGDKSQQVSGNVEKEQGKAEKEANKP